MKIKNKEVEVGKNWKLKQEVGIGNKKWKVENIANLEIVIGNGNKKWELETRSGSPSSASVYYHQKKHGQGRNAQQ